MADKVKEEIKGFIKEILAEHDAQIAQKYLSKAEAQTLVDTKNKNNTSNSSYPDTQVARLDFTEGLEDDIFYFEDGAENYVAFAGVEPFYVNTSSVLWAANVSTDMQEDGTYRVYIKNIGEADEDLPCTVTIYAPATEEYPTEEFSFEVRSRYGG